MYRQRLLLTYFFVTIVTFILTTLFASIAQAADTTPPTGVLSVSPNPAKIGETLNIMVTGNDNVDVWLLYAFFSGTWHSHDCSGVQTSCTYTWQTSESSTGRYTYYGYVFDSSGNGAWTSPSAIAVIIGDTTPPGRSNGQPTGTIATSSPTLFLKTNEAATCKYSTSSGVSYDSMTNTFSSTGGTSHSQGLSGLSDGAKNYYVRCQDLSGNSNTDDYSIYFTVDTIKPTTNIDLPDAGTWFDKDFTLQYDATDTNIDTCSISTKDGVGSWVERSTTCGSDKTLTITVGSKYCATEGKDICTAKVYAKDKAANTNEVNRSFSIDLTPPISSISHSPTEAIAPDTDVTINAQASDQSLIAGYSGLADIKIYVDDLLKQTCPSSPCLYTSKYAAGTHKYYSKATDKATNEASSSTQSFKSVIPETVPLKKGWNLASIPYITFTFASSTCDSGRYFYNYDTATKTWTIVKDVKNVQGGKGYWIYSDKDCGVNIIGDKEVLSSDVKQNIINGWNHIGSPASSSDFSSIKCSGGTIERVLYYDTLSNSWKVLTGSDNLGKYKGYFVKASGCAT